MDSAPTRPLGAVLGHRLRRYRERAGLTQNELALRTRELGRHINRVTIAKIEGAARPDASADDLKRANNATVTDVLVLAAALDVPPLLLFVPLGDPSAIRVGEVALPAYQMLKWVTGEAPLSESADDGEARTTWFENAQVVRLFRELHEIENTVRECEAALEAVPAHLRVASGLLDTFGDDLPDGPGQPHVLNRQFDESLRELDRHVERMRGAGIDSIPPLPDEWVERIRILRALPRQPGEADRP